MPPKLVEEMTEKDREQYETWREMMKPMTMGIAQDATGFFGTCGRCGEKIVKLLGADGKMDIWTPKYCPRCGQRQRRWNGDE